MMSLRDVVTLGVNGEANNAHALSYELNVTVPEIMVCIDFMENFNYMWNGLEALLCKLNGYIEMAINVIIIFSSFESLTQELKPTAALTIAAGEATCAIYEALKFLRNRLYIRDIHVLFCEGKEPSTSGVLSYENLKPPTSPTLTPNGYQKTPSTYLQHQKLLQSLVLLQRLKIKAVKHGPLQIGTSTRLVGRWLTKKIQMIQLEKSYE
uniref:Uncharacterized protein n=1 Tax=Tanacetum cinerariifolium TaxID=118510 RepID=A0A699HIM9_TANCI|nr:hypothetical protein [Tanacetum cinerariifolium]